jgi:hypothetical protein
MRGISGLAILCAALGVCPSAGEAQAQEREEGTHEVRRYDRRVTFDDAPVEIMAPTQAESKVDSLFAPLDFNRSARRISTAR